MPLFMDYHKGLSISIEDIKKAHIADESVQNKYGVVYHQFWVNEQDGTVFCLMEGPDKESCAAVHREAHGEVACSIVEVSMGFYQLFMGPAHVIEQGLVRHGDGTPDPGIRNILLIQIHPEGPTDKKSGYRPLTIPYPARELVLANLNKFNGREVNGYHDGSLAAVFDSATRAVQCAIQIQKELLQGQENGRKQEGNLAFKMGLNAGQPVTEAGEFFSEATTLARRLCNVAGNNQLFISSRIEESCNMDELTRDAVRHGLVKILTRREEDFLTNLFAISEENLSDEHFTIDSLSRRLGISRPQLYRKIVLLTGRAPNDFIRDLRMDKAISLIRQKAGNISEISLEVGYSNPSYFAKCFQMRYGCTPSRFISSDPVSKEFAF